VIKQICKGDITMAMTDLKSDGVGSVRIADDVLAIIAGTAALEAEGVAGLAGYFSNDIANKAVRKHMAKGVSVSVTDDTASFSIAITVQFGKKLQDVSREVQQRVKGAIETMTGLTVAEVNISVGALASEQTSSRRRS
jgi:uncharacterized alkaline shock family protein YloU